VQLKAAEERDQKRYHGHKPDESATPHDDLGFYPDSWR
jgi:hypothetical protein